MAQSYAICAGWLAVLVAASLPHLWLVKVLALDALQPFHHGHAPLGCRLTDHLSGKIDTAVRGRSRVRCAITTCQAKASSQTCQAPTPAVLRSIGSR